MVDRRKEEKELIKRLLNWGMDNIFTGIYKTLSHNRYRT